MKELIGQSANTNNFVINEDGRAIAHPEVILMLSEPQYAMSNTGGLSKSAELESMRFLTDIDGLRKTAAWLNELADIVEKTETMVNKALDSDGKESTEEA